MANSKPFLVKNGLQPQTDNDTDIGASSAKFLNAYISNLAGSVSINNAYTLPTADGNNGNVLKTDGTGNLFFGASVGASVTDVVPSNAASGDLWFDTGTTGEFYVYDGSQWVSVNDGPDAFLQKIFTADGVTSDFDTQSNANESTVIVYLNGILLTPGSDYIYSNSVVSFTQPPLNGDVITVFVMANFQSINLDSIGLSNHDLITVDNSGNITLTGNINMNLSRIVNLANPISTQDAATKSYVDSAVSGITPNFGNIQIAITDNQTIDTSSGNLILDAFSNIVSVSTDLQVGNNLTVTNNLSISTLGAEGELIVVGANQTLISSDRILVDQFGDINILGNLDVIGNVTIGGDITIGDVNTDSVIINSDLSSNLIPNLNDTYDLGTTTKAWRDLYLTESITFEGATGDHEIVLTTNLADALSVRDSAGDLMVFSTTSGSNSVSITPPTILSTSLQIAGTTIINQILDEDNMASNSNSALATQQSIKAYVDARVTAQDLDIAGDTGSGSVDLDSQTFTIAGTANEIETTVSGQTVTVGLPADVTVANNLTVTNQATVNGSAVLTTADEGSGNGLDADTVDGNHYADIIAEATALAIALG